MSRHRTILRRPILLCVDFDETITVRDTTSLLFQLSSSSASTQQQLVTQYVDEVGEFIGSYETKWRQRELISSRSRTFDDAGLHEFLEGYAAVDLRSVQRVVECRALEGIRHQDLVKVASSVQVRSNYAETLALADDWKIISVNWNKKLVESVITKAGVVHEPTQIIANDMKADQQGVTTGEINVKVQSPMDKARWIDNVRSMYAATKPTVVYVGDSATDLLALLAADVGIWIAAANTAASSAKLLHQLVENYGIDLHPLMNCGSVGGRIHNDRPVRPTGHRFSQSLKVRSEPGSCAHRTGVGGRYWGADLIRVWPMCESEIRVTVANPAIHFDISGSTYRDDQNVGC